MLLLKMIHGKLNLILGALIMVALLTGASTAIAANPTESWLYLRRAECRVQLGDFDGAVVLVTHDTGLASSADVMLRMRDGKVERVIPEQPREVTG